MFRLGETERMDLSFLDGLEEYAYVADIETYDLIYVNQALLKRMGLAVMPQGKCYRIFQGLEEPCPYCSNQQLKPGLFHR